MIIGLVGGVAAGKSFVAHKLASMLDGIVIDADRLARDVVEDRDVLDRLSEEFGTGILQTDGKLNRSALAKLVFDDSQIAVQNRLKLNGIVHPLVRQKALQIIEQARREHPNPILIIDAPLLLEAGWEPVCDHILYIDTTLEFRLQNSKKRGWSADELQKRESSQISLEEKRQRSSAVILNTGAESELESELQKWIRSVSE